MPKTVKVFTFVVAAIFAAYHYSGCSDDLTGTGGITTPMFGGYDQNEAGVMMTLSALCYVAEGNTNALQIRDSINLQLAEDLDNFTLVFSKCPGVWRESPDKIIHFIN